MLPGRILLLLKRRDGALDGGVLCYALFPRTEVRILPSMEEGRKTMKTTNGVALVLLLFCHLACSRLSVYSL